MTPIIDTEGIFRLPSLLLDKAVVLAPHRFVIVAPGLFALVGTAVVHVVGNERPIFGVGGVLQINLVHVELLKQGEYPRHVNDCLDIL